MISHWQTTSLFALLHLAQHACGQNASDLVGCVAVDCPTGLGNIASSNCQVAGRTLGTLGVTSYYSTSANASLSWTLGTTDYIRTQTPDRYDRYIERSFYLGTQSGQALSSQSNLQACALFFVRSADNGNIFLDDYSVSPRCDRQEARGFTTECVDALTAQVLSSAREEGATCSSISRDLEASLPAACTLLGNTTSVLAAALTGQDAPQALSSVQNSSSNCWPTLPKSNELTPVFAYNISATLWVNSTYPAILGTTPMMNVFFPAGNSTTSDFEPTAELLCLQTLELTDAAVATMQASDAVKRQPVALALFLGLIALYLAHGMM